MKTALNTLLASGALILFSSFAHLANTRPIDIAGRSINVPVPEGYCELGSTDLEKQLLANFKEKVRASARVLTIFAQCEEVEEARAGLRKGLQNYGTVQVIARPESVSSFSDFTRASFITSLATKFLNGESLADAASRTYKEISNFPRNFVGLKEYGVIGANGDSLQMATMEAVGDNPYPTLTINSLTLIKGLGVTVSVVRIVSPMPLLKPAIREQEEIVRALIKANS